MEDRAHIEKTRHNPGGREPEKVSWENAEEVRESQKEDSQRGKPQALYSITSVIES